MDKAIAYKLRYSSKARRLRIEVVPGEVRIVAPIGMSSSVIKAFVRSRRNWLNDKLAAFSSTEPMHFPFSYEECNEVLVLGRKRFLDESLKKKNY
ncbi:MAG: M48 family metallopeptidase, partial [bacterium]|nr:M48 family metallopeptidase [bacterium]